MRNTRQAVTRAQRAGYTVRCGRLRDLPSTEVEHLADLADAWRGAAIERGFSMALGRLDVARDPDGVVVTAEHEGQTMALLFLVPWGGSGRLSLDLMRRDSSAVSGVNELMIAELMTHAPALGVQEVSLNFAVFREALERSQRIGAGPVTKAWGGVLRLASRLTQVDTIYRFNAKFCPEWRSRYLLYPRAGGLARVGLAYLSAESFLPKPFQRPVASRPTGATTGSGTVDVRTSAPRVGHPRSSEGATPGGRASRSTSSAATPGPPRNGRPRTRRPRTAPVPTPGTGGTP